MHHLVCPIHTSHRFIIVIKYFWLHVFTNLVWLVCLHTLCYVEGWNILTSWLFSHTCTELGSYISKCAPFIYFIFSSFQITFKHLVLMRCISHSGPVSWPNTTCYHVLKLLPVGMCEGICLPEIVWMAVQLPCKDNQRNPKSGERNVDLSMGRLDWLDVIRATWGSHVEVDFFEWTVCRRWHISVCFGCHVTCFKYTNRTFADDLFKRFRIMNSHSFMYR